MKKNVDFQAYTDARKLEESKTEFYNKLWDDFYPEIYAYINRHNPHFPSLSEDIVMDVFTIALNHYETLVKHINIAGWMYTTAKNVMANRYRKALKHMADDIDGMILSVIDSPDCESLRELCRELLSDDIFKIIEDYYFNGYTLDEIAIAKNATKVSVKSKLTRAYRTLRNGLLTLFIFCRYF